MTTVLFWYEKKVYSTTFLYPKQPVFYGPLKIEEAKLLAPFLRQTAGVRCHSVLISDAATVLTV